ncbi:MAG: SDR family NAD(P)-dependent oxidoreductase [Luminiphilus sp.]|jgi:NAD(P)-dependent dehydrogenase (short-subunit alcohol dehydrogenase family)|nr:SDR family NAD(P)-dependent oxidoreductase [Luminiphilus sp.]
MSRHALITGGGTGIGAAIAKQLHSEGHKVSLVGRRLEPLTALAEKMGSSCQGITGDVTDRESVKQAFSEATTNFGPVEILINCAGIAPTAPFHRIEFEDWQKTLDVNLNGVFHCTQIALSNMKAAGWGRIVTIASTASLKGFAYVSGYCASKHAALGLTRALALETAQQGITVNAVCPGYVDTDIVRESIQGIMAKTGRSETEALQHFTQSNPQGRLIETTEVATSVSWLCSDGAASVTGQAIAIDGGSTA